MIKKIIPSAVILFALAWNLSAQGICDAYYVFEEGKQWEYHSFDKKGKLEARIFQRIISLSEQTGNAWEAEVESKVIDKNDRELTTSSFKMTCKQNMLEMDLTSALPPAMMESISNMQVTIEGNQVQLPADLSAGQELPDAYTNIKAGMEGVTIMNMMIESNNRRVEARERLETAAGNFDCYKISYELSIKALIKKTYKVVEWYAQNTGLVRSETYDNKGKLESYLELAGIN